MSYWTPDLIEDLIALGSGESQTLEFKATSPEFNDKGKAELLKDIAAMANSSGGSILYGITESDGKAVSISGIFTESEDDLIRRISQIILEGIEPKLSSVQVYLKEVNNAKVLIIEVPVSFDGPHRFKFNGHYRFVERHDRHISDLSYQQIRSAFLKTSRRVETLRSNWRKEFATQSYWLPTEDGPSILVKLSSLSSADGGQIISPHSVHDCWDKFILPSWHGGSSAYNYDGFAIYPGDKKLLTSFIQVYREGSISGWNSLNSWDLDGDQFHGGLAVHLLKTLSTKLIRGARLLDLSGSHILNVGYSTNNFAMHVVEGRGFSRTKTARNDRIDCPPIWIEELAHIGEVKSLVRPAADLLWQSFGMARCPDKLLDED